MNETDEKIDWEDQETEILVKLTPWDIKRIREALEHLQWSAPTEQYDVDCLSNYLLERVNGWSG